VPGKDRQRQLGREKAQRQLARKAAMDRRRRRNQAMLGSAVAVVVVIGLVALLVIKLHGTKSTSKPVAKAAPSPSASVGTAGCLYTRPQAGQGGQVTRKPALPPINGIGKTGTVQVRLTTNRGPILLTLDRAKAPCTVNSFVSLVQQKYFDKTPCHRLTSFGILQCGDPSGTGSGSPGFVFTDENLPAGAKVPYPRGTLAMANSGPNTNGSQFFLVFKDNQLDGPKYNVFGMITQGLPLLDTVGKGGSPSGDGKPKLAVTLEKAQLLG